MFRFSSLVLILYFLGAAMLVHAHELHDLQPPAFSSTATLKAPDDDLKITIWTRPYQVEELLVQANDSQPPQSPIIDEVRPAWGWLAAMVVGIMYVVADAGPLLQAILWLPSLF